MKETQLELISAPSGQQTEGLRVAINQGRRAQGLIEFSPALWQWRLSNPGGAHIGLLRDPSGSLQAAVIGLEHPARLKDQEVAFLEVLELFNAPNAAGGLAQTTALKQLCKAFSTEHGGRAPEGKPLLYGWPTRRAQRYLLSQQKAEVMRSEEILLAQADSLQALVAPLAAGLTLETVGRFPAAMEPLFERFAEGREALLIRDAARLNWRFAEHPERDYRIALVRREAALIGYAVQRAGAGERAQLVDLAVPVTELEALAGLLSWAAELTLGEGQTQLAFGVSTCSPEYRHFQGLGFQVQDSDAYMLFRSFQKPFIMSWLFHNWFYTSGDLEQG